MICRNGSTGVHLYDVDNLLEKYTSGNVWSWFEDRLGQLNRADLRYEKRRNTVRRLFSLFDHLEVLREDWKSYLDNARNILENAPVSCRRNRALFS